MDINLAVSFQRTYLNGPLAVVHNLPGRDAELEPAELRALAAALLAAATDCEAYHAELGRKGVTGGREYRLTAEVQDIARTADDLCSLGRLQIESRF